MARKVKLILRASRKKDLHGKLAEGYRAMADEDRRTAKRHLPVFKEAVK